MVLSELKNFKPLNYRIILFGLLEIIGGLTLGGGSVKLLTNELDNGELYQSIIRGALCFVSFSFVAISVIGFLDNRFSTGTNFVNGILGCILGLTLGLMFSATLYGPLIIAICIVCIGTLGFNIGLRRNSKETPYNNR